MRVRTKRRKNADSDTVEENLNQDLTAEVQIEFDQSLIYISLT